MVTQIPSVTNWSVTPQNGQVGYFPLMNTWLFESTTVISSLNTAIAKINEAGSDINEIGQNAINVITFDNIAQLKLNYNMGRVDVLGYYTKGDGGGGLFYWDNSSTEDDNGGTIIQATGITTGRWKRPVNDVISLKQAGAKGDGTTDNTIAIQNLINLEIPFIIPDGTFSYNTTLTASHRIKFKNYGKLKYTGSSIALDITTTSADLDFEVSPQIEDLILIGTASATGGIRINSVFAPRIINYTAIGFDTAYTLIFRNIALTSGQRWNESYYVSNINSNFNFGGIRFYVDGGTESFAYGYVQGSITCKTGSAGNQSIGLSVETTQLYNTTLDLNIWCNGYGTAIKLGSPTKTDAKIYWCNLQIDGELFNSNNVSADLTYGQIFGCTGFANLNMGIVVNPSNNRLEIYGQFQRTNYGNSTKQINGMDTKLTPLMANFQVEDAFSGKPEAGFGIATGSNMASPVIWLFDSVHNSFRVCKAGVDSEPDTSTYLFDVYYDGAVYAKEKYKAPKFASYETTFYATASTSTIQVLNVSSLVGGSVTYGTYLISANCSGANTNLSISGIITFSNGSNDVICPVATLATQDYNAGSIALQTYGNAAANTYSAGNGRKCQIVITNANASDMLVNVTITRIG